MFKTKRNLFDIIKYKPDRRRARFKNPFNLKKGVFRFKLFRIVNVLLFIGIITCLYFFIFSDFYHITNVEVSGNQIVATDDLLEIVNQYLQGKSFFILKNKNVFIFNKKDLSNLISQTVILDDINIEKILPNTIRLNLQERDAALKWVSQDQEYLVDQQGVVIKKFYKLQTAKIFKLADNQSLVSQPINDEMIIVKNLEDTGVNLNDRVLRPEDVDFILKTIEELAKLDYVKIEQISVPSIWPAFLQVKTASSWQIFFNFADSREAQLDRLRVLVDDEIKKENLSRLDYIDLRLGESVYYKFK